MRVGLSSTMINLGSFVNRDDEQINKGLDRMGLKLVFDNKKQFFRIEEKSKKVKKRNGLRKA